MPWEKVHEAIAKVNAERARLVEMKLLEPGDIGRMILELLQAGKLLSGELKPGTPEGDAALAVRKAVADLKGAAG